MKPFAILALGLWCLLPQPARAWGGDGHRIVCAIAWDELTPVARRRVQGLLQIQTRDQFADLCLWADEWRDQGHRETAPWHSMAVPPEATSVDVVRDCPLPRSCVLAQVEQDIATLKGRGGDEDKAIALKFLIHFVGDIHQPIHINHTGARGGAFIRGTFLGQPTDLHHVWDFDLIESTHQEWHALAAGLEKKITRADRRAWAKSGPEDWANESLAIAADPATEFYDHGDAPLQLNERYAASELRVAEERMMRAGIRLGSLLNGFRRASF